MSDCPGSGLHMRTQIAARRLDCAPTQLLEGCRSYMRTLTIHSCIQQSLTCSSPRLGRHVGCSTVSQSLLQSAEHGCRWLTTSCSRCAQPTVCPFTALS